MGIDETGHYKLSELNSFFSKENEDILNVIDQIKRLKCSLQVRDAHCISQNVETNKIKIAL